jgi:hypothetical protein
MANDVVIMRAVRKMARLLSEYAASQGWQDDQYKLYFLPDPEGADMFIIVVGPFPPDDDEHEEQRFEAWNQIKDFLEQQLHDEPRLRHAYNLVLRTPEEVAEGGHYAIKPEYIEAHEL